MKRISIKKNVIPFCYMNSLFILFANFFDRFKQERVGFVQADKTK